MNTQVLVNVVDITNLAAGASITLPHGLRVKNQGVVPTLAFPDRGTNVKVTAVDVTNITFQNAGSSTETVRFRVERGFSMEVDNSILPTMLYEGGSGAPTGSSSAGGGGYTYYLNGDLVGAPLTPGDYRLSLTYSATAVTIGPTIVPNGSYTVLGTWLTDPGDPGATAIPPGVWQLGLQARASHTDGVQIQFDLYKWDGVGIPVLIASSADQQVSNIGGFALTNADLFVPYTPLNAGDRLLLYLSGKRTVSGNRSIEVSLGGTSPSHIHTSFGAPGGTGLVKVVNGVIQDPASLLVNADVDPAAGIAVSKLAAGTNGYYIGTSGGIVQWLAIPSTTSVAYRSTAIATALNAASDYLLETTGAGSFTVTLPAAATAGAGRIFIVKHSGTGVITIDGNGAETIDGALTLTISTQYASYTLVCTGTSWLLV